VESGGGIDATPGRKEVDPHFIPLDNDQDNVLARRPVSIFRDAKVKGWPKNDDAKTWPRWPLARALTYEHRSDAHFAAYFAPDHAQRLTTEAFEQLEDIEMALAVFDVDAPDHGALSDVDEWWLVELPKVTRLLADMPGGYVYRTRGGYRLVYALDGVKIHGRSGLNRWKKLYCSWVVYLRRVYQIVADAACKDATRLYRYPCVLRDGVQERRETIGDPERVGLWTCEPTAEDIAEANNLANVKEKQNKPRKEEDAVPVLSHGVGILYHAMVARGWVGRDVGGRHTILCPWSSEHTGGSDHDSSTVLFAPAPGESFGYPHCSHAHCAGRTIADWVALFSDSELKAAKRALGGEEEDVSAVVEIVGTPALVRGNDGSPLHHVANVVTILTSHSAWRDVIAWDAFAEAAVTLREPPMRYQDRPVRYASGEWTEEDSARTASWLASECDLPVSPLVVDQAILTVAHRREIHPVRDYLSSLAWDGEPRIDTWLVKYFGAEDTPYTRGIGSRWLISAVARAFAPGCQVDCMLVLESQQQGTGKSTALEALAGQGWFADTGLEIGNKDSYQSMRRKWIYEFGELDSIRGREVTRVKNFISARQDTYRPSYGRRAKDFPRQCVFAGTTNESQYLEDHTGNRRFWPIQTPRIDVAGIARDRDQLWAEARVRYQRGEHWHADTSEFRALCEAEQADRRPQDPWLPLLEEWLAAPIREGGGFTTATVLTGACGVDKSDVNTRLETRLATLMKQLGWVKDVHASVRKGSEGKKVRYWWKRPVATTHHQDDGGVVARVVAIDEPEKQVDNGYSHNPHNLFHRTYGGSDESVVGGSKEVVIRIDDFLPRC